MEYVYLSSTSTIGLAAVQLEFLGLHGRYLDATGSVSCSRSPTKPSTHSFSSCGPAICVERITLEFTAKDYMAHGIRSLTFSTRPTLCSPAMSKQYNHRGCCGSDAIQALGIAWSKLFLVPIMPKNIPPFGNFANSPSKLRKHSTSRSA
jgi:hypothetical protein